MIAIKFILSLLVSSAISIALGLVATEESSSSSSSSSSFTTSVFMKNVFGIRRCHYINDWSNCNSFIKTSLANELEYLRKNEEESVRGISSKKQKRDNSANSFLLPRSDKDDSIANPNINPSPHVYSYICISTANSSNLAKFSDLLKEIDIASTVVLSKKSLQQSCFLFHSRLSQFKDQLIKYSRADNKVLFSAITEYGIVPSALKYNRYVFSLFDPTDINSMETNNPSVILSHGDKNCLNEMKKFHESGGDQEYSSSLELLVDFGLGTSSLSTFEIMGGENASDFDGEHVESDKDFENSFRQGERPSNDPTASTSASSKSKIFSRDEVYSLSDYISLHHENDHHVINKMANHIAFPLQSSYLSDAFADLNRNKHLCDFSMLKIEENTDSAVIRNLHTISSVPVYGVRNFKSRSCYLKLLAILGSKDNVINVAIRPRMAPLNANGKSIMQRSVQQSSGYTSSSFPYTKAGLNGTGQVIGIGDTGLDDSHCMFKNTDGSIIKRATVQDCANTNSISLSKRKVVQYVAYEDGADAQGGHGTHVSGTAVGCDITGSSSERLYDGHASGAKIAFFDMGNSNDGYITYPTPLSQNAFRCAKSAGANLYSASWGSGWNQYSSDSSDIDSYLFSNDNFLFIVAAGNDGSNGYFSIGDPAVSKNALTVGATVSVPTGTSSITDIAYFSSLGPSYDMRFKPDVVAPGFPITSAYASGSDCHATGQMSGTSMATPAVSGSAAQIRQYFSDKRFWYKYCNKTYVLCKTPPKSLRGATVKAAVIHSGNKMSRYYSSAGQTEVSTTSLAANPPDYFQGFGIVLLSNLLPISTGSFDLFFDELTITQRTSKTYYIRALTKNFPLKITLAWMDPPNSVISISQLVNDLDLTVTSPSGLVFHGNGNNGNFKDEINNVEQVYISKSNVELGFYSVKIFANAFPKETSQKASVIITSPGYVGSSIVTANAVRIDMNTLNCPSNNMELWIDKWDHSSNSWRTNSNSYELTNSNSVIFTGHMTNINTQVGQVYMREGLCVPFDDYTIELKGSSSPSDWPSDMGLSISSCNVFLSYPYNKVASIKVDQSGCNVCAQNVLSLTLFGSFFGVPYGWHTGTEFTITDLRARTSISTTLVNGVIQIQDYCIPDGKYSLGFSSLHYDDQMADDNYSKQFGVEEYGVQAAVGSVEFELPAVKCSDTSCYFNYDRVFFTISGGIVQTDNQTKSVDDDKSDSASGGEDDNTIDGIVLYIIIIVGVSFIFGAFLYSCKYMKTSFCGVQSVNPPQNAIVTANTSANVYVVDNNTDLYAGNQQAYAYHPSSAGYIIAGNPREGSYVVHNHQQLGSDPIYEIEMPQYRQQLGSDPIEMPNASIVDQQTKELQYYNQRRHQYQTISRS